MARYGYTAYDTRAGGRQIIEDVGNKINVTTELVKMYDGDGVVNWGLRVKGIPRDDAQAELKTTVVFYVGMETMEGCSGCKLEAREQVGVGEDTKVQAVNIHVAHPVLGRAGMHVSTPIGGETVVKTLNVSEDRLWQAKCEQFPNHVHGCSGVQIL